ncbi:MAG: 2-C-methyl-D-erythritol 4-phosphate cytidylyltransferase, partial [Candidatus Omnitrophota bacterium]
HRVSKGRVAAIICAAGKGKRLKSHVPKPFVRILGKPLLIHTLTGLMSSPAIDRFVIAADPGAVAKTVGLIKRHFSGRAVEVIAGGTTREASVYNALRAVGADCRWVLIHDAARPMVNAGMVGRVLAAAQRYGAAICATAVSSTVKRSDLSGRFIKTTLDRRRLYLAQTPQAFSTKRLMRRFQLMKQAAFIKTDDAALFEGTAQRVALVEGASHNIKVTTPQDLSLAEAFLRKGAKR